jgi:hypothetical protein
MAHAAFENFNIPVLPLPTILRNPLSSSFYGCTCTGLKLVKFDGFHTQKYSKDSGGNQGWHVQGSGRGVCHHRLLVVADERQHVGHDSLGVLFSCRAARRCELAEERKHLFGFRVQSSGFRVWTARLEMQGFGPAWRGSCSSP